MDFERSEDQELLAETVSRFLAEQAPISPYVRDRLADDRGTTAAVWAGLGDLGVIGLLAPESHGGAGMGMVDVAVVLEALGRFVHPGSVPRERGRRGQHRDARRRRPPTTTRPPPARVRRDRRHGRALGAGPPRALARAGDAARSPTATRWRLDGTKVHVPDAVGADVLFVVARRPRRRAAACSR